MMNRSDTIRAGIAWTALLLLAGCDSVTSLHPLSEESFPVDEKRLEGVWYTASIGDDVATLVVQFLDSGVARYATVGWDSDKGEFELLQSEIIITEGQTHNFMSIRPLNGADEPQRYQFLQYTLTPEGELHLWLPKFSTFEQAVSEGLLQGTIERGKRAKRITITDSSAALLAFVNDPARRDLFDYETPLIFRRIIPPPEKSEPTAGGDDAP